MSSPVDEGRTGSKVADFRKNCSTVRMTLSHIGFNRAVNGRVWVTETSNTVADVQRDRLGGLIHEHHQVA